MSEISDDGHHAVKPTIPAWKIAVMGISALSLGLTLGLSPAYAVSYGGYGGTLAWLIGAFVMIAMATVICNFAKRHVASGSLTSYIGLVFGKPGWAIVGGFQILGFLAICSSITASTQVFLVGSMNDIGFDNSSTFIQGMLILALIVLAAYFASKGVEASVKVSLALALGSVPPLILLMLYYAFKHGIELQSQLDFSNIPTESIVQGALVILPFMVSFESISTLAAETSDPKKNIPRLLYSVLIAAALAGIFATVIQAPLLFEHRSALEQGISPVQIIADAVEMSWVAVPINFLLLLTGFAGMIAFFSFAARVLATVSTAGVLPQWLSYRHPVTQSPVNAVKAIAVLISICLLGPLLSADISPVTLGTIYGSSVVSLWVIPYLMICFASIIIQFKEQKFNFVQFTSSIIGICAMLFMLSMTLVPYDDSIMAWLPWIVIFLAMPTAVWLYAKTNGRLANI